VVWSAVFSLTDFPLELVPKKKLVALPVGMAVVQEEALRLLAIQLVEVEAALQMFAEAEQL